MSDQTARTPTALVVDDDPAILQLLEEILQEAGFATTCMTHAQPALATLAECSFDLLLVDQWLPDGNGLQICEAARTSHGNESAVLIVTADARRERQVLALQLCADDFISKPFDIEELVARIDSRLRWVARARSRGNTPADLRTDAPSAGQPGDAAGPASTRGDWAAR